MLNNNWLLPIIHNALAEDIGEGDATTQATIPENTKMRASIIARESMVLAGLPVAIKTFEAVSPTLKLTTHANDGEKINIGDTVLTIEGDAWPLLAGERVALNFLQHLSGIATLTRQYVEAISHTNAILKDTRKTIPGLRLLAKYAASMGGAHNHRLRLDDAILIKDNHIAAAGSVKAAVTSAQQHNKNLSIQVECDTLQQAKDAVEAGATNLLLDNMDCATLSQGVQRFSGKAILEASGGVTLETIAAIAETGVDAISVGRITQSAPAVDLGLDIA